MTKCQPPLEGGKTPSCIPSIVSTMMGTETLIMDAMEPAGAATSRNPQCLTLTVFSNLLSPPFTFTYQRAA